MSETPQISLLLVDDQSIILDGLEALFMQDPELCIVGRASTGKEAVVKAQETTPDVILMDISMPEMDGIEATRKILKLMTGSRVLVLSMYNHYEMVHELINEGASGYVLKDTGMDELKKAIKAVANGEQYLAEAVERSLEIGEEHLKEMGELQFRALSKREKQVMILIAEEKTSQQMADELFLSVQTVDTHRRNILHKLGAKNAAGMVRYAMERGWLS